MKLDAAVTLVVDAPAELSSRLRDLVPHLQAEGVERLQVFAYGRPGEPVYYVAYLTVDGRRRTLGTPDLRHLPLERQADDLIAQLAEFQR